METLIAEDLLLLLLDDDSGKLTGTAYPQTSLGGALLIELALTGAVEVEEKVKVWRSTKVHPVEGRTPEDPILRAGYDTVAARTRSAQELVEKLGKGLQEQLAERLVQRGVLDRREVKALGVFTRKRWPTADPSHERDVRFRLTAVLVQGVEPDERTAALIALLSAIDKAHKMVDHRGLSKKVVRTRAKEISEGAWAAKAVKDAISAATAAVASVAAAGAIGASSAS